MQARDVMTAPVVTVTPFSLVSHIVELVLERRISGVPVVEGQRLVGIVSESDLLHRQEIGTDVPPQGGSWWRRLTLRDELPSLYVKSHGRRARDVMTRRVVHVTEDAPLSKIAEMFDRHRIRRVPVLRNRRLVGIVTRADLVRAVGDNVRGAPPSLRPSDDEIRSALLQELERHAWWNATLSVVYVNGGVVSYRGFVDEEAQKRAARVAAENVPGVRAVEDLRTRSAEWMPMW